MINSNRRKLLLSSLVILLPIFVGLLLWDNLPAQMATHWGTDGTPDGYSSKGFAVFALPLILLAVHWLCVLITVKDLNNKEQSPKVFGMVLWIIPFISLFSAGIVYAAAMGKVFDIMALTFGLLGLMFIAIGNYLPKCKPNRTIGIKIKWTLESEENWNVTHRMAGKLWAAGGVLFLLCILLPKSAAVCVMFILLAALVLAPVLYSYSYHRKQNRH